MILSTRGRYGLRTLLAPALHRDEGLVLLEDVARRLILHSALNESVAL